MSLSGDGDVNGDFGAFRNGLEARLVIFKHETRWSKCPSGRVTLPAALWPHWEAAASVRETETKCGSGLAQRCAEAAGEIPHSLPHTYLPQQSEDEARKPLREPQRPGGAVSPSRCESKKSTFRSLTRYLPICVWVNPGLLGWPGSILNYYKCFSDLI